MWSQLLLFCTAAHRGGDCFLLLQTAPLTYHQIQGWLPSSTGALTSSQPQSRESPTVRDGIPLSPGPRFSSCPDAMLVQSYASPATLSLPFVSQQKEIPSLHAYPACFISSSSQSPTYGLLACAGVSLVDSVSFPPRLLGVQSPLTSTLHLREEQSTDPSTSLPCWPLPLFS